MIKICLLMMFCCFVGAVPTNAEESAAPAPQAETPLAEAEPVPLSAARIATRVDETTAEILRLFDVLEEPGPEIGEIPTEIDALARDLNRVLQNVDRGQISETRQSVAETLLQTLNRMKRKLDTWHDALAQRTDFLDQQRQLIRQEISFLQELRASGEAEDLPDSIVERIDTLSTQLEGARVAVGDRLDLALDELSSISTIDLRIRENAQLLETRLSTRASEVFALEDVPIWQIGEADVEFTERALRELRSRTDATKEYVKANANESVAMILFLAFLGVIGYLAHRSIRRVAGSNAGEERTRAFLERPGAMVALLWAIIAPELILPPLPVALVALRVLVCVVALWRLIPTIMPVAEQGAVRPLIVLAAIAAILMIWPAEEAYGRFALIVIDVLGIYWFHRFGRTLRAAIDSPGLWQYIGRFITTLAPYLLSIGILGVLFGAVVLAEQISRGLFLLLIAILSLMVVESLLNTLTESFLSGSGRRWLHLVKNHQELIQGRISFFIRLGMLILLVMFIPRMFPMLEGAATGIAAVLTQRVEFGTVSISLTAILGLFISVAIALAVARFVRMVLDEDVFPRLSVAPGAAAAASRLIYYALVLGGIIFALAASGFELSSLTLLVSALGVGIGFGLQGIVNNFVSGLVLAFERPFQTGDMIAVGELFGRVRQIGLRASRIRTFEGAEVIVPNANLISGEVINWTLSDQMRRGDINVSVAYGSDTARVREELLKVAGDNERVARHPEPVALLLGFDDSSINFALRLWISEAGDWPEIASALYDAVYVAFAEAGIEIPFPQRTVHLHDNRGPDQ